MFGVCHTICSRSRPHDELNSAFLPETESCMYSERMDLVGAIDIRPFQEQVSARIHKPIPIIREP